MQVESAVESEIESIANIQVDPSRSISKKNGYLGPIRAFSDMDISIQTTSASGAAIYTHARGEVITN